MKRKFFTKKLWAFMLMFAMIFSSLPVNVWAAEDISVTVRFSAPAVAEDLATLRTDLLEGSIITEDDTDIPGDITVTVPKGSTVKAVLEAAKAKQNFTIEGLDKGYVTKIGFLNGDVANLLVNNQSNLSYPGWSFFIDGVGLDNGIGTDTIVSNGSVVEGVFSVYSAWNSSTNSMTYYDVELVKLYHELDAMVKQNVDTSGFSESAKATYNAAKSEAETLLENLYAQAKLNDNVAEIFGAEANTDKGMWIGLIDSKGIGIYGPGSPIEQLQKATEKLEEAAKGINYGPCDLTALSVADFESNPSALELSPAFSGDVTDYSVAPVKYQGSEYLRMCFVKATAASDSATIEATLGDVSKSVVSGGNATNFNNMVAGENNKLIITVTNGSESKTYTVTIPMKDADGNPPATEPDAPDARGVMDAVAAKYAAGGIAGDANAPWLAADMAAYAKAFPDTENKLSEAQKQAYLNMLIPQVDAATKPGDLAKYIIALRAMGYDARDLTTADGQKVDAVKKLTNLVDEQNKTVVDIYTLPYVLIALQQGNDYATTEQIKYLKEKALEIKDKWQTLQFGSTDAAPPMILALSPYYSENSVKTEIDKAVQFLKNNQDAVTGAINYNGKASASSTGIAAMALAAIGTDPAEVKVSSGKSLIDGLMATVNEKGDGFDNAFGTEQGFRGLIAWQLAQKSEDGARVYDFADMPAQAATAQAANCPLRFNIVPTGAKVTVKQNGTTVKATAGFYYDLPAGDYSYTATLKGYNDATGIFTVSDEEAANHQAKMVSISLTGKPGGSETKELSVRVKVMVHDGTACNGKWTYKNNADKFTALVDTTVKVKTEQTAFDAFALAMEQAGKSYVEKTWGYISQIEEYEELEHGANSGWQYMIDNTLPTVSCRDYKLKSDGTMTWFYTDDYTKEQDAGKWSGGSSGNNTEIDDNKGEPNDANGFTDTKNHWAADAINFVVKENLFTGTTEKTFEPETAMNRAMLTTVLWRLDGKPAAADKVGFTDLASGAYYADAVTWAAANGIVKGYSDTQFAPNDEVTREQMAAILCRYAEFKGYDVSGKADLSGFADNGKISAYAVDNLKWAKAAGLMNGRTETTLAPQGDSTRAEVATMIQRFVNNVKK